jgi:hypothetical protein
MAPVTVVEPHATRPGASRRLLASLDRVLWQRVELGDDGPVGAVVAGTRRRRPATVAVDADTALALVDAGVPTVVRRVGSAS